MTVHSQEMFHGFMWSSDLEICKKPKFRLSILHGRAALGKMVKGALGNLQHETMLGCKDGMCKKGQSQPMKLNNGE